jgi:adenylylsulfate reductase, subunit B
MPSFVNPDKCDGCKALDKTACQYICPNNLMALNKDVMKAYNREPDQCWECQCCVKTCPTQAIDIRGYADFMPLGASVIPLRSSDAIMWTVKFRNGSLKRFRFPTRTVAEGKVVPSGGWDSKGSLDDFSLYTEPASTGCEAIAAPGAKTWIG